MQLSGSLPRMHPDALCQHLDAEACAAPRILAANVDGAPRTAVLAAKACAAASTVAAALDGAPQTAAGHDAQAAPLPQPG